MDQIVEFVMWGIVAFLVGCSILLLVACLMAAVYAGIEAAEEKWGIYLFKSRTFFGRLFDVAAVLFFVLMIVLALTYVGFMLLDWFGIYTKLEF